MRMAQKWCAGLIVLAVVLGLAPRPSEAAQALPPLVFVARGRLASRDYLFTRERGPAGQLTSGLSKFAPGSKLLIRTPEGVLLVLMDTSRPPGDPLNPFGLRDLQSPDVSFDARRIVFAGTSGPYLFRDRAYARPRFSWRLYEIGVDGSAPRQLTRTDRDISIPGADAADTLGNAEVYSSYDDLFPAYLADGRIVFSSSRYPSRSHYDGRPTFNLYVIDGNGGGLHRITTERGGALHPTPLPDGRILWSRWWVNFNQPSDTTIYSRIDNRAGGEPARDANGNLVLDARGNPVIGYRLPDNTLVYSNTNTTFTPARGRLPDGALIRNPPNTWHLMTVDPDGTNLQRYAWTPRYAYHLTTDSGQDSFNAAQPALVISGTETLVAYTTQSDGTMAHTTLNTGIRLAYPGIDQAYRNTTESIAGYRWDGGPAAPPFALHPAGLPDGRILFSQTFTGTNAPLTGQYTFTQNGRTFKLPLQSSSLRYELHTIRPGQANSAPVPLAADIGADAMDAKPIVVRPVGRAAGQWRILADRVAAPVSDDPPLSNIPRGLFDTYGQPAYTWSARTIEQVALAILHNPNVYANPPLDLPYANNSPPVGSVAFADIYIDANQFTGARYNAPQPDDQVRAVKWTTVPVDARGAFAVAVPADTPVFIVLRDKAGRVVRGGNRSAVAAAQGNAPGRAGQVVTCVGCHMGHVSGSLNSVTPLAQLGWTNVAPAATVTATSEWANGGDPYYHGRATHLTDRRNYVPTYGEPANRPYQDRTLPWIAAAGQGAGQALRLDWALPIAMLDVRLVGAEPGQAGFSADYRVSGELRFFLGGVEIDGARRQIDAVAPLGAGGTTVRLPKPVAADRIVFTITGITGRRYGAAAPAALAEIEVVGQGATPAALARRPEVLNLPVVAR